MRRVLAIGLAIVLGAHPGHAQGLADFSGQWNVVLAAPTAPAGAVAVGDMGIGWGPSLTITQSANELSIEYVFYGPRDLQPPMHFIYALDGSDTIHRGMAGLGVQEESSTVTHRGDSLIITTASSFVNPDTGVPVPVTVTRTLSLASPTSLVIDVTRHGVLGGEDTSTRATYTKASG